MSVYLEKIDSTSICADLGTLFRTYENSTMHQRLVRYFIIGMALGIKLKC